MLRIQGVNPTHVNVVSDLTVGLLAVVLTALLGQLQFRAYKVGVLAGRFAKPPIECTNLTQWTRIFRDKHAMKQVRGSWMVFSVAVIAYALFLQPLVDYGLRFEKVPATVRMRQGLKLNHQSDSETWEISNAGLDMAVALSSRRRLSKSAAKAAFSLGHVGRTTILQRQAAGHNEDRCIQLRIGSPLTAPKDISISPQDAAACFGSQAFELEEIPASYKDEMGRFELASDDYLNMQRDPSLGYKKIAVNLTSSTTGNLQPHEIAIHSKDRIQLNYGSGAWLLNVSLHSLNENLFGQGQAGNAQYVAVKYDIPFIKSFSSLLVLGRAADVARIGNECWKVIYELGVAQCDQGIDVQQNTLRCPVGVDVFELTLPPDTNPKNNDIAFERRTVTLLQALSSVVVGDRVKLEWAQRGLRAFIVNELFHAQETNIAIRESAVTVVLLTNYLVAAFSTILIILFLLCWNIVLYVHLMRQQSLQRIHVPHGIYEWIRVAVREQQGSKECWMPTGEKENQHTFGICELYSGECQHLGWTDKPIPLDSTIPMKGCGEDCSI